MCCRRTVPNANIITHLEPLDDPASFDDIGLDRPGAESATPASTTAAQDHAPR